jgi:hypothetical protein
MKFGKEWDEKLEAIIKKVYAAGLLNSPARVRDCTRQIKRLIAEESRKPDAPAGEPYFVADIWRQSKANEDIKRQLASMPDHRGVIVS